MAIDNNRMRMFFEFMRFLVLLNSYNFAYNPVRDSSSVEKCHTLEQQAVGLRQSKFQDVTFLRNAIRNVNVFSTEL